MRKLLILMTVSVISCTNNTKEINLSSDISKAEKLTDTLYSDIKKKDYGTISKMLDKEIKKENFSKVFVVKDSALGNFESYKIDKIETERNTFDKISKVVYVITAQVQYEKRNALETITFTKDSIDNIWLSGYTYKSKL